MMNKINETKRRAIVVCALSLLCGALLAVLRLNVLFGAYDPSVGLYPECPNTSAFEVGLLVLSLSLMPVGFLFSSGKQNYEFAVRPVVNTFAGGLVGFGFLALGASIFITSKISGASLSRFDGVLVVLSLVCAASFWMESFSGEDKLSEDAVSILMLFRPICCLLISFYFYFDDSSVIHNSNKKMVTLFFAVVLLSLLYEVKMRVSRAKMPLFVILNALSVCYSIMYAVPGLVWYFANGEGLILSVFFDMAGLFLGVWCAVRLLSITSRTEYAQDAVAIAEAEQSPEDNATTEKLDCEHITEPQHEISDTRENEI